jgi:drug/metabolite transporter (DMT)-like permease
MLIAATCFSFMGASSKLLKGSFNAGQLVFYRNAIGFLFLSTSLIRKKAVHEGGKLGRLIFRGLMGAVALYTLLYCVLHLPLGTAMTYNLTSAIFITIFSFFLFGEFNGWKVIFAVIIGFAGMLMVYKPGMHLPWYYHFAGLLSGCTSAIAYLTVGKLTKYYDKRIIVLSFLICGLVLPGIGMLGHYVFRLPADEMFFIKWKTPLGIEWLYLTLLALFALIGQYFVTLAYSFGKAGVVSAINYFNIVVSVFLGQFLGDKFPDALTLTGILFIIASGVMVSIWKS